MQDVKKLKKAICEIGDRIYKRGFAAANDGNISVRLNENEVLCTPTMHCKGFLKPKDICLVDMEGNQLAGKKKRSSEVLLHLEIMKARPDVQSVVHCHPPHATAFAIAREPIPQAVLPEVEVFLGEVPISPYETPGGKKFAETILPFVQAIERDHSGQSRHGELRRIGRAGVLVDGSARRLLPHSDSGAAARADSVSVAAEDAGADRTSKRSGASPTRDWPKVLKATSAATQRFATRGQTAAWSRGRSPSRATTATVSVRIQPLHAPSAGQVIWHEAASARV